LAQPQQNGALSAVPPLASGLKLISFESAAKVGSEPRVPDAAALTKVCSGDHIKIGLEIYGSSRRPFSPQIAASAARMAAIRAKYTNG
jgi:hypothetical protein